MYVRGVSGVYVHVRVRGRVYERGTARRRMRGLRLSVLSVVVVLMVLLECGRRGKGTDAGHIRLVVVVVVFEFVRVRVRVYERELSATLARRKPRT